MKFSNVPMTRVERLAHVAYCALAANGNLTDPTLHDISNVVVQAAALLHIVDLPDAPDIEMQAVKMLCEENVWADDKRVVVRFDKFARRRVGLAPCTSIRA